MKRILCVSILSVLGLVGVMIFSPLAFQFDDEGLIRGAASEWEIDSLVVAKEYKGALNRLDSIITEKNRGLPRFAYLDRFLSKKERYEAGVRRAEIYELQWKRIEILQSKNDKDALKEALDDYVGIIGYNQERAKDMLEQLKKK